MGAVDAGVGVGIGDTDVDDDGFVMLVYSSQVVDCCCIGDAGDGTGM